MGDDDDDYHNKTANDWAISHFEVAGSTGGGHPEPSDSNTKHWNEIIQYLATILKVIKSLHHCDQSWHEALEKQLGALSAENYARNIGSKFSKVDSWCSVQATAFPAFFKSENQSCTNTLSTIVAETAERMIGEAEALTIGRDTRAELKSLEDQARRLWLGPPKQQDLKACVLM